jgi:hypothetical protein
MGLQTDLPSLRNDSQISNSRYSGGREPRTTCGDSLASDSQTMMLASTRIFSLLAAALWVCAGAFAQANTSSGKNSPPASQPGASLPQDKHEGLTVSVNSYTEVDRAKEKFGKANPLPVGILPVEVFLHNETTQPMRIDVSTIQLSVQFPSGKHQDVDAMLAKEVAAVVAHPNGPSGPQSRRFPVGIGSIGDKKTDKMLETLEPLALDADIVPPMATIHGFVFFDLNGDLSLAANASLYVPDVTSIPSNKALMFFEVPLGK